MNNSEKLIEKISKGVNLNFEESKSAFLDIMNGNMHEDLIYEFLVNLSKKGETADEISGGVFVLRQKALKVEASKDCPPLGTCATAALTCKLKPRVLVGVAFVVQPELSPVPKPVGRGFK